MLRAPNVHNPDKSRLASLASRGLARRGAARRTITRASTNANWDRGSLSSKAYGEDYKVGGSYYGYNGNLLGYDFGDFIGACHQVFDEEAPPRSLKWDSCGRTKPQRGRELTNESSSLRGTEKEDRLRPGRVEALWHQEPIRRTSPSTRSTKREAGGRGSTREQDTGRVEPVRICTR